MYPEIIWSFAIMIGSQKLYVQNGKSLELRYYAMIIAVGRIKLVGNCWCGEKVVSGVLFGDEGRVLIYKDKY